MKGDAGREGSEGNERLLEMERLQYCSVGDTEKAGLLKRERLLHPQPLLTPLMR